jgi:hypothetical protein
VTREEDDGRNERAEVIEERDAPLEMNDDRPDVIDALTKDNDDRLDVDDAPTNVCDDRPGEIDSSGAGQDIADTFVGDAVRR